MNQDQFRKRLNQLFAEERNNPLGLWYLSYAEGEFLGGVYIEAHGPAEASYLSNRRGYSPGGQVLVAGPVPSDRIPDRKFWNRLLTKEELQQADSDEWKTLGEWEAEENNG